ncbi:MAG: fibronectin type III domain-containing protein, partial [Thermodesulfobacteriota bacterium]
MQNVSGSASCSALSSQACNGELYYWWSGSGIGNVRQDLPTSAVTDLKTYLAAGQNFFGIGFKDLSSSPNDYVRIRGAPDWLWHFEPELTVTYCELLGPPTLLSPANGASCVATTGTLDWSDVSGATGYKVQIGTSCGSGTEYPVTSSHYGYSLQPGTKYYWRVCTRNSCGYGPWSGCFAFTTDPGPLGSPTLQSPANNATCQGTSGTLDWSDVSGAAGYRVQIG